MSLFRLAAEYDMLPRGGTVLCAVSGGADSMYLLARLLEGSGELGYRVTAAHFDHGLRETARRDAEFVRGWCAEHGVPCVVGRGDVAGEAKRRGTGIEETARSLRYAFLEEAANELGAEIIATAHNADDNAETLLMNLTRGSGLEGLCGIPPRRGRLVRPMLTTTREEIEGWLAERGIPHMEDETNADERYTRNFLRHRVMPLLKQVNPKAVEHMTGAAARLRRDNDVLGAQAARVAGQAHPAEDGWVIAAKVFDLVPDPVALRAVRQLLVRCGGENVTAPHLNAVLGLIRAGDPSAMLHLPKTMVRRVYGDVLFTPWRGEDGPLVEQTVEPDGETVWGEWVVRCERRVCPVERKNTPFEFWLSAEAAAGPLTVSPRREGDALQPFGRPNKTLKKWFTDEKIPRMERDRIPVLRGGGVIAAGGIGAQEALLAEAGEAALHFTLIKQKGADESCILT